MKYLTFIIITGIALVGLYVNTAFGNSYPIYPPGTFVTLQPADFIQYVPEQSPGLPDPNPVIGDNLGQHPGAFGIGFPPASSYFVGVFGRPIDTSEPGAVYLWETTMMGLAGNPGPQITLGYWDGNGFAQQGDSVQALYYDTGVLEYILDRDQYYELNSSVTPLSDFHIKGNPGLNAVMIEAVTNGHNQVIAVAVTNVVPEPSTILLLGSGLVGIVLFRRKSLLDEK